ncbi:hypothetical protein GUJ93_ZPchr0008g13217 [Zizania palustris]|uniref:ABC transporter domain-containing protein n=1 Tax=Zizania palustris TaxID=103762 RepID=A0A8J5V5K5_ZIZPA|nr:hypothetical protein GUJ93_ZPchr0008g13217 [Zizania palustris]
MDGPCGPSRPSIPFHTSRRFEDTTQQESEEIPNNSPSAADQPLLLPPPSPGGKPAMVSDASKKKAAQKKAAAAAKRGAKASSSSSSSSSSADKAANGVAALNLSDRTCTGVLASHPLLPRYPQSLSLTFHGHDLIVDSELELNYGRRYGLLGLNGCGKSTLLTAIGCRELPIPEHMDIYHLSSEIEASDMSSLQAVICCDEERMKLEKEAEILSAQDDGGGDALDRKENSRFFWWLAYEDCFGKSIVYEPNHPLLDEPTNHLDLEACVWLEETLKKFDRILVVISHSQDFLNGVCTNIIHMQSKKLKLYTGSEQRETLAKMERGGLTEKVARDKVLVFRFTDVGKLPPPVLQFVEVSFGYTPDNLIYKNLDFGVDLDSRIALVGPNGAGKSTLLKLMTGDLTPLDGMVRRHNHLRIAQYHQHLAEKLDLDLPALEYMMKEYPGNEEEKMRAAIGKFGLSGKAQVMPMRNLSDGQKSRVIFAWLAYRQPQLLLLDEPTNHLDIETIDSLAEALNEWDGGLVLVSHDFRLINQVAQEIWVCEKQAVTRWEGGIMEFKEHLRSRAGLSD